MRIFSQLASAQKDIWHDQQAHPKSPLYNIGGSLILSGKINYKYLNEAIQYLINENDAFRITINNELSTKQKLLKKIIFNLEFIDFSKEKSPKDTTHQWLTHCFQQPFTFEKNNLLWHFALIKETDNRHYLMTKYHHLIADGWSTTVVIARLAEIYNGLLNKKRIKQKPTPSYFDFIKKEQAYLNSSTYLLDSIFWKKTLPIAPEPLISRRYSLSFNTILPKAHNHRFIISRAQFDSINQFSSKNKSTSYQTFLSTLAIYFSRAYQREDIVIGIPSLNRKGARFKNVFGMFINLSPLVLQIDQSENFYQITQNCKARLRNLYRHQQFPLNDISKRLKLLHEGRDTLFDIILSYEKHQYSSHYGTATTQARQQFSGVARYPLAITICDFNGSNEIEIFVEGAEDCFTAEDLQCFSARFLSLLQQLCTHSTKQVKEIDLLTAFDKKIIFEHFNKKPLQQHTYPHVIQLFQQQVKKQPEKIALEFKNTKISYEQLDRSSTQLAQYMLDQGVKSNEVIAIYLPQSPEIIISILAILKISSAYIPISTDIPEARISKVLQQSQANALLTNNTFQSYLNNLHDQIICVDSSQLQNNHRARLLKNIEIHSEDLAYIIFTSGSSGVPKGVMISHKALSLRIHWLQSLFKLTSEDRVGQTINYSFDPSVIEIFLSLTQGASLILKPESDHTAKLFAQFIVNNKISSLALVPSSLLLLLQGLETNQKTDLKTVCCGGERLPPQLARQFSQKTEAVLFNAYGPTEATIIASAWQYEANSSNQKLPIGIPADSTSIYIMDKQLNHLPVNIEGEIIIAGDTLALGYINQSEINSKVFSTTNHNQSRLYRTGDKGYIGYDGLLYFSGRIDRQVKISGYRIELGEIESLLLQHSSVDVAAVTTHLLNQKSSIYAYIETQEKNTDTLIKELSDLLRQQLPTYMQAKNITALTAIETDKTGKIDYSKLPFPNLNTTLVGTEKPQTSLEKQLHTLWKKALPFRTIGTHENFFDLGGDSISAISLMISIEKIASRRYPLSFLLKYPTISEQAIQLGTIQKKTSYPVLHTFNNHSDTPALFIAASGEGDFIRISNLASLLNNHCSVHMLQPPSRKEKTLLPINTIAQHYADNIIKNSSATYYIAGFSIGGVTALETAKILVAKGKSPKRLILLDSIYPRWPLCSPALFKLIQLTVNTFSLDKRILNNQKIGVMLNDPGIRSQLKALPHHDIQGIEIPVDLILTKRMWMFHPLIFSTWKKLFKQHLTHYSVSGLHGEMFQPPHCQRLATIIKKIIQM